MPRFYFSIPCIRVRDWFKLTQIMKKKGGGFFNTERIVMVTLVSVLFRQRRNQNCLTSSFYAGLPCTRDLEPLWAAFVEKNRK